MSSRRTTPLALAPCVAAGGLRPANDIPPATQDIKTGRNANPRGPGPHILGTRAGSTSTRQEKQKFWSGRTPVAEQHGSATDSIVVVQAKTNGPRQAADEIARQLAMADLAMLVVFVSPFYDPQTFIAELSCRMPDVPIFGCTTAGELSPDGWSDNSVVAMGFNASDFRHRRPAAVRSQRRFRVERRPRDRHRVAAASWRAAHPSICDRTDQSVRPAAASTACASARKTVMSAIYASLDNIPVVGGSAGDGLRFEKTWVFYDGEAYYRRRRPHPAPKTALPFRLFKCDNFEPTSTKMVVTEADIERRVVKEINAEPAAEEYSRAVGIMDTKLDAFSFAAHPVLVRVGGAYYARSIQRMNPDGSLSFFCAIDEGMVLTGGARRATRSARPRTCSPKPAPRLARSSVYIGFECVLRRLDAEQQQFAREMSDLYRKQQCGRLPYLWRAVSRDAPQPDADRHRHRHEAATVMTSQDANSIEALRREAAKLRKINAALMSRVERSIDQQYNAFSLFETAIALDHQVLNRTKELQAGAALDRAQQRRSLSRQAAGRGGEFAEILGADLGDPRPVAAAECGAADAVHACRDGYLGPGRAR